MVHFYVKVVTNLLMSFFLSNLSSLILTIVPLYLAVWQ